MKQITSVLISILLIPTLLMGCGNAEDAVNATNTTSETEQPLELNQNDYRGSLYRIDNIREGILSILKSYMDKNMEIQTENPSNYWESDDFVYMSTSLLDTGVTAHTIYLNETQSDWDEALSYTQSTFADDEGYINVYDLTITRNSENNYTISYRDTEFPQWSDAQTSLTREILATYDANHDWSQTISYATPMNGTVAYSDQLLEYARNGNIFIVQTETERLYAVFEEAFQDVEVPVLDEKGKEIKDDDGNVITETQSISLGNQITEFYYSKLDGEKLAKYAETGDEYIFNSLINTQNVTESGEVCNQYNPNLDSIFTHLDDITSAWVTSEGSFSSVISYKDGDLVAKIQNKLSHKMEVFTFDKDGHCTQSIEEIAGKSDEATISKVELLALMINASRESIFEGGSEYTDKLKDILGSDVTFETITDIEETDDGFIIDDETYEISEDSSESLGIDGIYVIKDENGEYVFIGRDGTGDFYGYTMDVLANFMGVSEYLSASLDDEDINIEEMKEYISACADGLKNQADEGSLLPYLNGFSEQDVSYDDGTSVDISAVYERMNTDNASDEAVEE